MAAAPGHLERNVSKSTKSGPTLKGKRSDKGGLKAQLPDSGRSVREPGWAEGLRKLYDTVVAEPLPDHFEVLLKKLDQS